MDLELYGKLKTGIVAECESCTRKFAALDVLFDCAPPPAAAEAPPTSEPTPALEETEPAAEDQREPDQKKDGALTCSFCPNRVRVDNAGCPGCGRKICRAHRRPSGSSKAGYCTECAPALPDGRQKNGGPRLNSGLRPNTGPRGRNGEALRDFRPGPGKMCESCDKKEVAVIRCAGCAKMIGPVCARKQNGQCKECNAVPV